ncbi:MAG: gliding motility-associated C-terminal domain-containing protein [Marinilabiliaceae bacterium]|nr:gliding motility-associated C-terminal domain-containing protein [Marinilabiliaceae bacterium]
MNRFALLLTIIFGYTLFANVNSQIIAPSAKYIGLTNYSSGKQDSIYFFLSETDIELICSNSVIGNNFSWYKYDLSTDNWGTSSIGNTFSLSNISDGGYKVEVTNNGTTSKYICWVFVPNVTGTAEIHTEKPDCGFLASSVTNATPKILTYVDINSSTKTSKTIPYQYRWISEKNKIDTIVNQPTCDLEIYYNDNLSASIGIGKEQNELAILLMDIGTIYVDSVKAIKAYFTQKLTEEEDNTTEVDPETSAKLEYIFNAFPETGQTTLTGDTINTIFTWEFFKKVGDEDEKISSDQHSYEAKYSFTDEGTYYASLTVSNDFCEDIYDQAGEIIVSDTYLLVPNVFTPNGDGINETFKVSYTSIKKFQMVIVNRWGRIMFETTKIDDGWDGKYGGKMAPPGVYYYDVVAEGYDGVKKHKKGFLHLITDHK